MLWSYQETDGPTMLSRTSRGRAGVQLGVGRAERGAVRPAEEADLVGAEGPADGLHVADVVDGRQVRQQPGVLGGAFGDVASGLLQPGPGGALAGLEVGARAVEVVRVAGHVRLAVLGSAQVEADPVVGGGHVGRQLVGDPGGHPQAADARTAGVEQDRALPLVLGCGGQQPVHRDLDRAPVRTGVIEGTSSIAHCRVGCSVSPHERHWGAFWGPAGGFLRGCGWRRDGQRGGGQNGSARDDHRAPASGFRLFHQCLLRLPVKLQCTIAAFLQGCPHSATGGEAAPEKCLRPQRMRISAAARIRSLGRSITETDGAVYDHGADPARTLRAHASSPLRALTPEPPIRFVPMGTPPKKPL